MALFRKKEDGKEDKPTTLEEVRRAYENLSDDDRRSFHQSIADRVHESIAAQEREHGQEDSQSAAAREHEALGEEHAHGEGEVEELHEDDDTEKEKEEDKTDEEKTEDKSSESADDRISGIEAKVDMLLSLLKKDDAVKEKADEIYGIGNGIFADRDGEKTSKQMSKEELVKTLKKFL